MWGAKPRKVNIKKAIEFCDSTKDKLVLKALQEMNKKQGGVNPAVQTKKLSVFMCVMQVRVAMDMHVYRLFACMNSVSDKISSGVPLRMMFLSFPKTWITSAISSTICRSCVAMITVWPHYAHRQNLNDIARGLRIQPAVGSSSSKTFVLLPRPMQWRLSFFTDT